MNIKTGILCFATMKLFTQPLSGADSPSAATGNIAASAINTLGLELLAQGTKSEANAVLSPYSIQLALAMTYAGADGETRAEMAKVLHYPNDDAALQQSFKSLQAGLDELARKTAEDSARIEKYGAKSDSILLTTANRLFGQKGYDFREQFLALTKDIYGAPLEAVDFAKNSEQTRELINDWVAEKTRQRILDLIPSGALDNLTNLVLVNAVYLKAPWADEFPAHATGPRPFYGAGGAPISVATMHRQGHFGYAQREGFQAISIPYLLGELQFIVLLPEATNGLPELERKITPELLSSCARLNQEELSLEMPKFKLQPELFRLSRVLEKLGMKTAFDQPRGAANFDRMAPRKPGQYLYISEVFHKTFLALDEKGTEAAAATAVAMRLGAAMPQKKPREVHVDHPFFFAIQHRATGACLFLGRISDPHA
jgi:serpin B